MPIPLPPLLAVMVCSRVNFAFYLTLPVHAMGELRYNSTHSECRRWIEVNSQNHDLAALLMGKNEVPIKLEAWWAPEPAWTI